MGYSMFKYGSLKLSDSEDLEAAKEKAIQFVTPGRPGPFDRKEGVNEEET